MHRRIVARYLEAAHNVTAGRVTFGPFDRHDQDSSATVFLDGVPIGAMTRIFEQGFVGMRSVARVVGCVTEVYGPILDLPGAPYDQKFDSVAKAKTGLTKFLSRIPEEVSALYAKGRAQAISKHEFETKVQEALKQAGLIH